MEALIKSFLKSDNETDLKEIISFISTNPIDTYLQSLNDLILAILHSKNQSESKYNILIFIVDLFINTKIPSEHISNLSLDRIFNHEEKVYQSNPNEKALDLFYSTFFSNQSLINSLTVDKDTEIDFLSIEKNLKMTSWTRGLCRLTDKKDYLMVTLEGVAKEISINQSTFRIQPRNLFSKDYEWKINLKKGDEVDFLDKFNNWYSATVIERQPNSSVVKIGLRIYHEKTQDDKDKQYVGYGEEQDIECNIHDSRIRPPHTFSRNVLYIHDISAYPIDNKLFNEEQMQIPFNDKFYLLPKEYEGKNFNILYHNICNYFLNSISKINSIFVKEIFSISNFDYFCTYCNILFHLFKKINLYFAMNFLKNFYKKSIELLIEFSKTETRNFKKTIIQALLRKIKEFLKIVYYDFDLDLLYESFGIEFGLNCLKISTILEKQLLGITILSDTLTAISKKAASSQAMIPVLSLLSTKPNIFTLLFETNSHSQIIQKSADVASPFFQMKLITEKETQQLISYLNNSKDPEIEVIIYKIFSSNANHLDIIVIKSIINYLLKKNNPNGKDITLLIEITKSSPLKSYKEVSNTVVHYLFELLMSNKCPSNINYDFCVLLKCEDNMIAIRDLYLKYLKLLMDKIDVENFQLGMRLMKLMLTTIPSPSSDEEFKNQINKILFGDKNIFNETISFFNNGKYDEAIFDFLTDLLENVGKKDLLSNEIIKSLFEVFSNKLADHNGVFFKWLKEIENKKMIQSSSLEFLFNIPIKEEISKELFEFLWSLFISINAITTGADIMKSNTNNIKSSYTGMTLTGKMLYSFSYAPSEKPIPPNYILPPSIDPFDLKYFDIIYIALMNIKSDEKIKREILSEFFQIFSMKGMNPEDKKSIWLRLINKAISIINNPSSSIRTLRNSINILTLLIEESERKGTAGCVSHMASMKSSDLTIKITNMITKNKDNKTNDFELIVKSNLTIWDLKKAIANRLDIIPECIKILHNSNEISDRDNGAIISNKFNKQLKINIAKSNVFDDIPKIALIKDGQLTPEVTKVFTEIFEQFSTDGKMNHLQCSQFAFVAVDSIESISVDDPRVRLIFDKYDTDKDDYVTLEGFIQFFHDAIEIDKKVFTVWENIKAFNYRNDLKKFNEPLEDYNNDNDYSVMPRNIMGQEQHIFEAIFACQYNKDKELVKEASELINMLCTNKKYSNIILDNNKELEEIMTKETNEYILFYIFQIVESFFENKNDEIKRKWLNNYLTKGGFEHLIKNKFLSESIDYISTKVSLCIRKIILGGYEILMNMEQYDRILDKDYLTDELILKKDLSSNEISSLDGEKYKIREVLEHLYQCIEVMIAKDNFIGFDEEISKKQLNIFTLLALYLKGEITINSNFDLGEFILKGLLYSKESILRRQFCFTFGLLFLEIRIKSLRDSLFNILEKKAFDLELIHKYNPECLLSLYELLWKIQPQSTEKTELFVKNILECLVNKFNTDQLLSYFKLLAIGLDNLSLESKIELCQEKKLLQMLVDHYLLEDVNKEEINKETPDALFTVIQKLIEKNSDNLHTFFTLQKIQTISKYITQLKQGQENYNPIQESRSSASNYIGIHNLRNICYMNSVIQQFFNISAFRYGIILADDHLPPQKTEISDDNLLHQLRRMFTFLQLSNRHDYVPTDFVYSFKDIDGKPTDFNIQCDAQEFLSRFMDKIEVLLSKTEYKYLMKGIFYGETCSQLLCQNGCGSIRNRFEELLYLSLDIKNVTTLNDTLLKYIGEETIDGFLCEQCQKKTKHSKRISLNKLPNVLIIHLQRITFNYETFVMEKINSKLEFPMKLTMKPYTTETISQLNPEDKEYDSKVYEHIEDYYQYELKGVVVHNGTAQFGHYYSFINTELGDHAKWYRFDDSTVFPYSIDKLNEDTFGGDSQNRNQNASAADWLNTNEWEDSTQGAYMLVYERKLKTPLQLLTNNINESKTIEPMTIEFSEESIFHQEIDPFNLRHNTTYDDSFLDCENTASSRNDNHNKSRIYKVKNEYIQLLPYYHFIRNLHNINYNKDYQNEVRRDNIIFKNDMSIYHSAFVDLIKTAAKELSEQSLYLDNEKIEIIYRTITKIIIEILTKYNEKKDINDIINYQLVTLKEYPFLAEVILKEIILNKNRYIYTLILTIEDKINLPFTNLITDAIKTSMQKENEINQTTLDILDYLFSLFPVELSKNWVKMVNFLEIIASLAKEDNSNILGYLYSKNTITVLIDFFLGKESPLLKKGESRNEIGNRTVNAKFAPLISTLSLLIRRCPNLVSETNPSTYIKSQTDYFLNQEDINILNTNAFYKKAITEIYHHSVLSKLLSHLMYNDIDFTQKRIYYILEAISTSSASANEVKNIFSLLFNILTMEDKLTLFRFEAIVGIPMISFQTVSNNSEKLVVSGVKYRSNLFPNKDSLIKKMTDRWRSSVDNVMFISYLFGIVYGGKSVFNYYQSLLSPRAFHLSLNDYIIQQANNEIEWLKTCNFEKKYGNYIQIIQNCYGKLYKEKSEEIDSEKIIRVYPQKEVKKILSEKITNVVNKELNDNQCYLLKCDYLIEITEQSEELKNKKDDEVNSDQLNSSNTIKVNQSNDKDSIEQKDNKTFTNEEKKENTLKENEDKQQQSSSLEDYVINKEQLKIEGKSNNHHIEKLEQNNDLPLFQDKLRSDYQIKTNVNYSPAVQCLQEKKYYLDNIDLIITQNELNRVFYQSSGSMTINLRSYLLVNNSEKEYRTTIKIVQSSSSYYYSQSPLINFLKKNSCSQVITICPNELSSNDTLELKIIPFDLSNKSLMAEQYEQHVIDTLNQMNNNFKDEKDITREMNTISKNEKEGESTNYYDNYAGEFEMKCPFCDKNNMLSNNEYICELKCNYCQALLFQ